MKIPRRVRVTAALTGAAALAVAGVPALANAAGTAPSPAPSAQASPSSTTLDPTKVDNPDQLLPKSWRTSKDRSVTTIGDADGLNVLVADASSAYQWRTAASLSEPGFDSPQWIGQDCVTGSGRYAAVTYAPWSFANDATAFDHGAFAAIVDLDTGAVRKLAQPVTLSYFSPGCGTGDSVAFSALTEGASSTTTQIELVNAATGALQQSSTLPGQVTSPVPYGNGIAAVAGDKLISITATGATSTLSTQSGIAFQLHPDKQGGLAFQVPLAGNKVEVRRFAAGTSSLLGTGDLGKVQVRGGAGGNVFLIGPQASKITLGAKPAGGWVSLGGPAEATPSTLGQLELTAVSNHVDPASLGAAQRAAVAPALASSSGSAPNSLVAITATVTGTGKSAKFDVVPHALQPGAGRAPSPALTRHAGTTSGTSAPLTSGKATMVAAASPLHAGVMLAASTPSGSGASTTNADDSANPDNVTWDPTRGCAVARNDASIQTFQANAQQIEWAADLAVQGQLTVSRGINWEGSGMPVSWTVQGSSGMFPLQALDGGGSVPAQVLLGVLAQESNTLQASPHAVDAETGNFNQGGFYGNPSSTNPPPDSTWSDVDCGYGAGQVTTGMNLGYSGAVADGNLANYTTAEMQQAIATDYASNIAATLNMLIDKWNQLYTLGILANGGAPQYIENWWLAVWAYNSGVEPANASFGNTTGCTPGPNCTDNGGAGGNWGLGWLNNPANPQYPADRQMFNDSTPDASTPQNWTYPEKVIGWADSPVARLNYAAGSWSNAYAAATYPTGVSDTTAEPSLMTFCTQALDSCTPDAAADKNGAANTAGLCTAANQHCWLHSPVTWESGCASYCGKQVLTYTSSSTRPSFTNVYAPDGCTSPGSGTGDTVPSTAVIVDGSQQYGAYAGCLGSNALWTSQGTMTFHFPESTAGGCTSACITNQGKIDFHQLGSGLDGHMWFSHMINTPSAGGGGTGFVDDSMTATWTPPSTTTGWQRIEVHIPKTGATTAQANYIINLGNGQTEHRIVNQHWNTNTWVDLGSFNLSAGASVQLSNYDTYVTQTDGGDVAFDAVAFVPTVKPVAAYVALGDSYSAGEGDQPYNGNSDNNTNACHRSPQAYSYSVIAPGQSQPIQQVAAANGPDDFAFVACSGAVTTDLTVSAVDPNDSMVNTVWKTGAFDNNEPYQIDDSGYLDANTTLVSLSIGGNDSRFAAVVKGCIITIHNCSSSSYYLTDNGTLDPQPLPTYETAVISALQTHLQEVYQAIHTQAPNAKIVVVGYPYLFPTNPTSLCETVATVDQTWMNSVADDLDGTISAAVSATAQANPGLSIQYVDPRSAFTGHDICASTPWVNGIIAQSSSGSGTATPGSGSFHPMPVGQSAYATLINSALGS